MKIIEIIKSFFLIINTDKISLYKTDIRILFYYIIFYVSSKIFNILENIFYIENFIFNKVIISNKSVIIEKKRLIIVTLNIKHKKMIDKIYSAHSQNIKMLTMINT